MSYEEEMVKIYVPESAHMNFEDALCLAIERDEQAAETLAASVEHADAN